MWVCAAEARRTVIVKDSQEPQVMIQQIFNHLGFGEKINICRGFTSFE
jgi:hypothetical protein